jgi:hypothetical protein
MKKGVTIFRGRLSLRFFGRLYPVSRAVKVVRLHEDGRRNIALLKLVALEHGLVWARKLLPSGR